MGRKHCARRWWCRGQHHSSTQVAAESVASAMSCPSFSLFSDSQSLFSPNPRSSHVENTTENVELEGGKGNNINASSVDETPYHSLPDTNSEPVIGGVHVTDKGKVIVQIRVMHHLLIREVHHEVKNEMRFVVNDSRLRFDLGEFALVTGPKCKGDTSIESIAENRLISKYFGTASVTLAQLADCFMKKKWETDDNALKIAVLYFMNNFLLSQLKTKLKNITPTDDEKQLFDVCGLNFEIEVECTDSQPDSFQHKQQDNYPDFHEMHNDYDQFERGHVGNDPVVIGDSTHKAPSMSGFGGVGRDEGATGVNVKNVTASHGVVNDDLRSAPFVNEHDLGLDSNFELSASAIDQITAITQQATYKQSSHDVKKSGPAPLPSGIPTQTRADVVIESNTAPQASRVDGVGQVNVGGINVNFPSAPCQHGGDLYLDSDFEYTYSQLDLIAAITQGGRRNVKQSGNELTTRDVNKSKPNQSVSRSIVQTKTDVETTPTVFTRRRRPGAIKQSPYRNDWQFGVSVVGGSSKVVKGRFSFVNDISVVVDYKLTTAFLNFVEANMQLGECVFVSMEVYLPGDQKLDPCFDFEVEQIDDKMFFHTLNYSGRLLSSSHLNIIFYYLRKKAKYGINMPIKVTTTDTLFNNIIQRIFTEFVKGGKQDHLIDRSDDIMEYMKGFRMHCNTLWHQVDHVLFPTNLVEEWHWILGSSNPVANFDVDGLRARFGILLWHYGRNKQLHGESSESKAPVAPKKTRGKKRKK
ncbi:hypothetical protein A4A49_64758 [Nicotiana attenuata]|uniref:DUF1985 domain-containing protein n=1 Tax=Nicotiana attenuata TaxID=49451 RepID=A0A314KR22_NICAT|nr:hypothetical protein A4A49_64758 [Nicotiana attenuata]